MGRSIYEDAVVVVTGAGSGLGKAMALELGERKAFVVVADIDEASAIKTADEITDRGGRAEATACDVTIESDLTDIVLRAVEGHGRLDIMINNAGIAITGEAHHRSREEVRRVFDVNFWGVYHGTMAAYETMRRQRSGTIVNIASIAGLIPLPHVTAYVASKHAVVGFSTSLAIEAARSGVRIMTVCPGSVRTGLLRRGRPEERSSTVAPRRSALRPMEAERAARLILEGVQKRKPVIVIPFLLPRLYRLVRALSPRLYNFLSSEWFELVFRRSRKAARRDSTEG